MKINALRALIQEVIAEETSVNELLHLLYPNLDKTKAENPDYYEGYQDGHRDAKSMNENETPSKDKPESKEMTWEELLAAVKKMVTDKQKAAQLVKAIKESLDENLNEGFFGIGEPATDAQLDAWLAKRPNIKTYLNKNVIVKYGEDVYKKWREFVKKKFKKEILNGSAIMNVSWDSDKGEWRYTG
jgi:hypothetical protein